MTLHSLALGIHTLIAVLIIGVVLLQRGKGADAGAAFGSGASGTVFGARGSSNFLSRMTAVLATAFFASSLTLAFMSSQRTEAPESLIETAAPVEEPVADEQAPEAGSAGDEAADERAPAPELPPIEDTAPEEVPEEMPSPQENGTGEESR